MHFPWGFKARKCSGFSPSGVLSLYFRHAFDHFPSYCSVSVLAGVSPVVGMPFLDFWRRRFASHNVFVRLPFCGGEVRAQPDPGTLFFSFRFDGIPSRWGWPGSNGQREREPGRLVTGTGFSNGAPFGYIFSSRQAANNVATGTF